MSDSGAFSDSSTNLKHGMACSNCRRRKIASGPDLLLQLIAHKNQKCDGVRPCCDQCSTRPPRSINPCVFNHEDHGHQTPAHMRETIKTLKYRIEDLEGIIGQTPSQISLHRPYASPSYDSSSVSYSCTAIQLSGWTYLTLRLGTATLETDNTDTFQEPPVEMLCKLLETFLDGFTNSGSAILPLSFGHVDRPSPSLLSAVYLWGSVLSTGTPTDVYSEDVFLLSALKNLTADIRGFSIHPKLVFDTIQAEVLLSLYYLHAAIPVQGRYHATGAASLTLSAGLHTVSAGEQHEPYLDFPLAEDLLTPQFDQAHEMERFEAFWSVMMLNNCWLAAYGCPSAIPSELAIDIPWPSGTQTGATIAKFLDGDDQDGYSPVALVTKASILLERVISLSGRTPVDVDASNILDKRLNKFQSALPPSSGNGLLFMAHALTDLAIIRLHARCAHTSQTSRYKCLATSGCVVSNTEAFDLSEPAHRVHPMLGLSALSGGHASPAARAIYNKIQERFGSLMNPMVLLAGRSPVMQRCLESTRHPQRMITDRQ
ncbi:hypothetical protein C8R44DRAFT_816585 [Mycena epipterygia]|nr:hypothetical protein C8R44DRAFT_816585 [Mycena epipterygia]